MIIKSNCNHIATSLDFELQNENQDDNIDYIKEDLVCYIEKVSNYGFDHIIIIREHYCRLLFIDRFGHDITYLIWIL
jgi:hypothetical protein